MNTGALIMMIIGCTIVWAGLFLTLAIALKKEKIKKRKN
ncbi:MAG: methionine/alanine import family NSS transporter small subunit [Fusobacteriaceae bacterium]